MNQCDNLSEDELARKWQLGDDEAASFLYQRLEKHLLFYIYGRVGNYHDAQELLSDVFIRVATHIGNFRFECSFKSWLFTIANHIVINYFRSKKRQASPQNIEEFAEAISTSAANSEDYQLVVECLQELPERDRSILLLRYIDEYKLGDIAEVFEISIEGIRKIVNKSIEKLRFCVKQKSGGNFN